MPIERKTAVVKRDSRGMIMTIYAICDTKEQAWKTAENANQWYGELHPLTPLTVEDDVLVNPPPFPEDFPR